MKNIENCIVRHGDLVPDKSAFIDAHTPGSNQKENFTILGGGVSESPRAGTACATRWTPTVLKQNKK